MRKSLVIKLKRIGMRIRLILARDRLKMLRREKNEFIMILRANYQPGTSEYRQVGAKLPWYQDLEKKAVQRVKNLERQLSEA